MHSNMLLLIMKFPFFRLNSAFANMSILTKLLLNIAHGPSAIVFIVSSINHTIIHSLGLSRHAMLKTHRNKALACLPLRANFDSLSLFFFSAQNIRRNKQSLVYSFRFFFDWLAVCCTLHSLLLFAGELKCMCCLF